MLARVRHHANSRYAVVIERELIDDAESQIVRLVITDIPAGVDRAVTKATIDRSGRYFGRDNRKWVDHTVKFAADCSDAVREQIELGTVDEVTFEELEDEAHGEKRVTLRIPKPLFADLTYQANRHSVSFNELCIAALSQIPENLLIVQPTSGTIVRIPQRDAMRALYQIHSGNKSRCIQGWIALYKQGVVAIGKHPDLHPPDIYSPQLWNDGERKGWLTDRIPAEIVAFVRSRMDAEYG
jgi:hypothetical protein